MYQNLMVRTLYPVNLYLKGAYLGVGALLVPELDGVLAHDVGVVQDAHHVAEQLQQLAVLVAVHLQAAHGTGARF